MKDRTRIAHRSAFTMIELMLSAAIMSILLLAITSAMLLAGRAMPDGAGAQAQTIETAKAVTHIVEDLNFARYVIEQTDKAVTVIVADRTGDGEADAIRYAWSGTVGDPVTVQVNGGAVHNVIDAASGFSLAYETQDRSTTYSGPLIEGPEQLLAAYAPGAPADPRDFFVEADKWPGQHIQPALPAGTVTWRVTRVEFRAKHGGGANEQSLVRIHKANASKLPTSTVLEQHVMDESTLVGAYAWRSFQCADVYNLLPSETLCMVIRNNSGVNDSAKIEYDHDADANGAEGMIEVQSGGSSASYRNDRALIYRVYGKASTRGPSQVLTRRHVTAVRLDAAPADPNATPVSTTVQLVNQPEALAAFWTAEFDNDPTAMDMNNDAKPDWAMSYGTSFDTGSLSAGVWQVNDFLRVFPDDDFDQITTVDLRWRDASTAAGGGAFHISLDWAGGVPAQLTARITLEPDNTQTFTITHHTSPTTSETMYRQTGLSSGFMDLRLILDATTDIARIIINGEDRGGFGYRQFNTPSAAGHYAELSGGGGAQTDHLRIGVTNP